MIRVSVCEEDGHLGGIGHGGSNCPDVGFLVGARIDHRHPLSAHQVALGPTQGEGAAIPRTDDSGLEHDNGVPSSPSDLVRPQPMCPQSLSGRKVG